MAITRHEHASDTTHRIVVGVDGSEHSMAALEWAAAQAELSGSALEIVAALGPGYQYLSRGEMNQLMQNDVTEALARAETLAPGVNITTRTFESAPESILIEEGTGADLLVVGSRGRGGFKGLLLGSVSRKCVHRARCPVVVVAQHDSAPNALTSGGDDATHRIVVGLDGSPSSIAALEWAANQAESTGAFLEVLMTWEWFSGYGWSPIPPDFDPAHSCETKLNGLVEPVHKAHPSVVLKATVIEGLAAQVLVEASEGADLLVVGNRGHGEFVGMLLGSVSEHCVTSARCPVLVLHDGK